MNVPNVGAGEIAGVKSQVELPKPVIPKAQPAIVKPSAKTGGK